MKKIEWNLPEERRIRRNLIDWYISQYKGYISGNFFYSHYNENIRKNVRQAELWYYRRNLSYYASKL